MKPRTVLIVSGMAAIFVVAIVFGNKAPDAQEPPIKDAIVPSDNYDIKMGSSSPDTVVIKDAIVPNNTDVPFYYENGKKHYTISAVDEPSLSD